MSRPRSESGGPAAAASNRRRRALGFEDLSSLPKYMKLHVLQYVRPAFTNASLRAAVEQYFRDKAATERRHGKMNTWDVGRVTDMSRLFSIGLNDLDKPGRCNHLRNFNEDISAWDTSWAARK